MDDRPTIQERLHAAFLSGNLQLHEETRSDLDYLVALGMAEQRSGRVGSHLMRLQLGPSLSGWQSARDSVVALTRRMATVRNWGLSVPNQRRVAELALLHHLFPACPSCLGRGYAVMPGAPVLTDQACEDCHGLGKRPIRRQHRERIKDVIDALEKIDAVTEDTVRKILR